MGRGDDLLGYEGLDLQPHWRWPSLPVRRLEWYCGVMVLDGLETFQVIPKFVALPAGSLP